MLGTEASVSAVDGSMVECGRLAFENHQKMQRIEHLVAVAVAPHVLGDDLAIGDHLDAIDVALHRHRSCLGGQRQSIRLSETAAGGDAAHCRLVAGNVVALNVTV